MTVFYCEDAILVARNQEAMEASRRRMQEELDAKAVVFREKQKEVRTVRTGAFHRARSDLSSFEFLTRKRKRREDRNWTGCSMGRASELRRDSQK